MQKQYVGIGVLVLVVIAAGWYFVSLNEPKAAPVVTPVPVTPATTTDVATSTTSAPTTPDEIELDLSKLQGKDRLYTEEEGKYENLSAEEQRLVEKVFRDRCGEYAYSICSRPLASEDERVRLIALNDGVTLVYFPYEGVPEKHPSFGVGDFPGTLTIYNAKTTEDKSATPDGSNHMVVGPDYIVKLGFSGYTGSTLLQVYKPGMETFDNIMPSILPDSLGVSPYAPQPSISYVELSSECEMEAFPIEFNGSTFTAYLHAYDVTVNKSVQSKKTCEWRSKYPIQIDLDTVDIVPVRHMQTYQGAKEIDVSILQ
jgi:hypothetical protein